MKQVKSSIYLFAMLCSGMTLAGCSSEEELTYTNKPGTMVMYATTSFGNNKPDSRMSYEDEVNGMRIKWSEGDAFSVFTDATAIHHDFIIGKPKNGSAYTADETFSCTTFPNNFAEGTILDAIYPKLSDDTSTSGNITLSIAAQAQTGNSATGINSCDYMTAHAKYSTKTPSTIDFQFKDAGDGNSGRLGSIYRVALQSLPKDVTSVSKIEISAINARNESSLVTEMGVNFTNGSTATLPKTTGTVTLTVTDGATTIADGKASFNGYVVLFPSFVKTIKVVATTNDGVFTWTKTHDPEAIYTRGQFKLLLMDMTNVTPDRTSLTAYNAVGSGTAADPYLLYTEAQLKDWAEQNNSGNIVVKTVQSRSTGNAAAYFKLAGDIALTAPASGQSSNWTPIGTGTNPFTGHFDGNGKSVTGMNVAATDSPYNGFIGRMTAGELKDVTVAGTVDVTNTTATTSTFAGGLVASLEGGKLSGILKSEVAVTASSNGSVYAGGLVGAKHATVTVAPGASLSATGTVSATISNPTKVTTVEIGAGSVIGNGTNEENTKEGAGAVSTDAPGGTTIVTNGVSNKVDIGFTINPWKPVDGGSLGTE